MFENSSLEGRIGNEIRINDENYTFLDQPMEYSENIFINIINNDITAIKPKLLDT